MSKTKNEFYDCSVCKEDCIYALFVKRCKKCRKIICDECQIKNENCPMCEEIDKNKKKEQNKTKT